MVLTLFLVKLCETGYTFMCYSDAVIVNPILEEDSSDARIGKYIHHL